MNEEVLKLIRERGLLLEKEIFDLINQLNNGNFAVRLLENLERISGEKVITRALFNKNFEFIKQAVNNFSGGEKKIIENTFFKIGISLEIRTESKMPEEKKTPQDFQIFYSNTRAEKKLEVSDFVGHFRSRYHELQRILMQRPELGNLISINKISGDRQSISIIGIVKEKRVTKNKNLVISFEDLTGEIKAVVRHDKEEIFSKADELQLDDVVGIRASGNRNMLFVNEIYFPDSFIHEKIKFNEDVSIAFLSDVHCGSDRHLKRSFENFIEWINSEDENAKKIKYLFFSGDNVDGVGIFPGQEKVLALKSMREQYSLLASYIRKIPKRITVFMCPGQHDAVRVAEPQPIIDRNYAPELYEIENLVLVTNPTIVKLIEGKREFKVLMYHGASIHTLINEIRELREIKAHQSPARAVMHMLKRRHLAPTHSSVVYIPNREKDPLVISEVPDVLCTGEVHRLDIENYNGVMIITGSCWQAQTPFEEKVGNIPDPGKVPVLNLKTRELRIFDFGDEEEINREY